MSSKNILQEESHLIRSHRVNAMLIACDLKFKAILLDSAV